MRRKSHATDLSSEAATCSIGRGMCHLMHDTYVEQSDRLKTTLKLSTLLRRNSCALNPENPSPEHTLVRQR